MTTRREFLQAAGLGLMTPFVASAGRPRTQSPAASNGNPVSVFGLSVASGDPAPTGVVLWTRVNPDAWSAPQTLTFEVARDRGFHRIVVGGDVDSADFGADRDYTVHLDLAGWLALGQTYYYRFRYQGVTSRTGRCRTLPAPGSSPKSLRLGVLTCQDYTNGYYGGLAQLAQDNVDFVLHLGDFIYETTGDPRFQSLPYPDRAFELPSGQPAAVGLNDYRFLYRQYRSDPLFQQLLEAHTLICLWDDHETANDSYWDYERDTLGAPDHPFTVNNPNGGDPQQLRQLKLDAQQAWAEYVPARVLFDPGATHPFDALQIYRRFQFGDLVELFATDERTYRSAPPCGVDQRYVTRGCDQQMSPLQTMLGDTQREWFVSGVVNSPALWKVWANEVFLGQLKVGRREGRKLFINLDAWDGFEAERTEILERFANAGVRNLVALTGDLHTYMAAVLKIDYLERSNRQGPNTVGVEFMTPAVTSSTLIDQLLSLLDPDELRAWQEEDRRNPSRFYFENLVKATNPHVHFFNSQEWGYSVVEFTRRAVSYAAYSVDTSVNAATASRRLIRLIRVPVNTTRFQDIV